MQISDFMAVSGQRLGDVRAVLQLLFESGGPLNPDSDLSPGEVALLLALDYLTALGLPRDRAIATVKHYSKVAQNAVLQAQYQPNPVLLLLHDQRYAALQLDRNPDREVFDSENLCSVPAMPCPPAMSVALSLSVLYHRACATLQCRRESAESGSAGPSTSVRAP